MGQRIKMRRDTSANWTSNNPILQAGELGWDSTLQAMKIGNGTSAWSALKFISEVKGVASSTIAIAGAAFATTFAHFLGVAPDGADFYLLCNVANIGYAVGDRVYTIAANQPTFVGDATNMKMTFSALPLIHNKGGTAAPVAITAASWSIVVTPIRKN